MSFMCAALTMLAHCSRETGEQFARALWPELMFEDVIASKMRHRGGHGCTYVVLTLPDNPVMEPPKTVPQWMRTRVENSGEWRMTSYHRALKETEMHYCLHGNPDKIDGAGMEGFGIEFAAILKREGAWWISYASGVDHVLMIYAPDARRALHVRLGD
ncbi:hypothetical protein [uncultured Sulfitobacter sp.]|uniref:hypothetical protein n=1 Tax=uncultured Sulfitobacter sp. TaxID=191468 RepID=UPI00262511DA|nr:hypothetical protein [uncultured Sulfitobacter sp.]